MHHGRQPAWAIAQTPLPSSRPPVPFAIPLPVLNELMYLSRVYRTFFLFFIHTEMLGYRDTGPHHLSKINECPGGILNNVLSYIRAHRYVPSHPSKHQAAGGQLLSLVYAYMVYILVFLAYRSM